MGLSEYVKVADDAYFADRMDCIHATDFISMTWMKHAEQVLHCSSCGEFTCSVGCAACAWIDDALDYLDGKEVEWARCIKAAVPAKDATLGEWMEFLAKSTGVDHAAVDCQLCDHWEALSNLFDEHARQSR